MTPMEKYSALIAEAREDPELSNILATGMPSEVMQVLIDRDWTAEDIKEAYDLWITLDSNLAPSAAKDAKGSPLNWKLGAFFKAFGKSVPCGNKLADLVGGRCIVTIKPEQGLDGQPTGYAKVTAVKKL